MKMISLRTEIGKNVVTRASLRELLDRASEDAVFDFSGVSFMSRSCADEYIKFKEKHSISQKNVPEDVQIMLDLVEKNRKKNIPSKFSFTPPDAIQIL